ncbi:MAG: hypothetical protein HUK26_06145, partial [Duodenibacillus sp.]|nr:hypothetical protein [Duodenibacillus sp.]
ALYGQTSRLGALSQSTNDVMTRGTGECSAAVLFAVEGRLYKARWRQWRSRGRPEGSLQPPAVNLAAFQGALPAAGKLPAQRELGEDGNWKTLADKVTEFREQVDKLLKMSFAQFTQSAMLTQGAFAKFLNADEDDRSGILEKITGTGIYSDISHRVHYKAADKLEAIKELEREMGKLAGLAPEERQAKQAGIEQMKAELALRRAESSAWEAQKAWRMQFDNLGNQRIDLERKLQDAQAALEAAAHERERLHLADLAEGARTEVSLWQAASKAVADGEKSLETIKGDLQRLKAEEQKSGNNLKASNDRLEELRGSKEALDETLKAVRQLDAELGEAGRSLRQAEDEAVKARLARESAQKERDDAKLALDAALAEQRQLEEWLRAHAGDAALVRDRDAVNGAFVQWEDADKDCRTRGEERDAAVRAVQKAERKRREEEEAKFQAARALDEAQKRLRQARQDEQEVLAGRTAEQMRRELQDARDRESKLGGALKDAGGALSLRDDLAAARSKVQEHEGAIRQLQREGEAKAEQERQAQALFDQASAAYEAVKAAKDFGTQRQALMAGRPCPLCGSEHHPYCEGQLQAVAGKAVACAEAGVALKRAQQELRDTMILLEGRRSALPPALQARDSLEARLRSAVDELQRQAQALLGCGMPEDLAAAEVLFKEAKGVVGERVEAFEAMQRRLDEKRAETQNAAEAEAAAGKAFAGAQANASASAESFRDAQSRQEQAEAKAAASRRDLDARWTQLQALCGAYVSLDPQKAQQQRQELLNRAEAYADKENACQKNRSALPGKQERQKKAEQDLADAEQNLSRREQALQERRAACKAKREARRALFGDRNADAEEAAMRQRLQAQEEDCKKAAQKAEAAKNALEKAKGEEQSCAKTLESNRAEE